MAKVILTITQTPEGKFFGDVITQLYKHETETQLAEIAKSYGELLANTIKEQLKLQEAIKSKEVCDE